MACRGIIYKYHPMILESFPGKQSWGKTNKDEHVHRFTLLERERERGGERGKERERVRESE